MQFNNQNSRKNTIVGRIVYNIILFSMLHSTFVAPAQNIIYVYFNQEEGLRYKGFRKATEGDDELRMVADAVEKNVKAHQEEPFTPFVRRDFSNALETVMSSDIQHGFIGITEEKPLDDVSDNLFKVVIKDMPERQTKAYLVYELYGLQDYNGVSRSINDRLSTGGHIIKHQSTWALQKEEIDVNWLRQGENRIMFSIPEGASLQYQVKNLRIEFEKDDNSSFLPVLATSSPVINFIKDNKFYVKGFLRSLVSKEANVYIEDTKFLLNEGEFEGFVELTEKLKQQKFVTIKAVDATGLLGQELLYFNPLIEADGLFPLESYPQKKTIVMVAEKGAVLKTDGASITIKDSALMENKEVSITHLRRVDVAPMASGMINVTKGGSAYRFLPDGTKFKRMASLSIGYDEKLIPNGYNAKDIKTFYFNTHSKSWIPVTKDTIDEEEKVVVSFTDHFTDYINGIIQTPESPETAGFTPTMMNDIKAADPSSEITLISPPEVSQKGEANISYPIKIPSGRNGMQPQLTVQYNSDGGSGWLGQGWNINIPAISIDTRWGVPKINNTHETVIYTLGGEQLMYPKITNSEGAKVDWMPNRQFDATSTVVSTEARLKIATGTSTIFTPRKQGSFAKIERMGSTPSAYYWKVTNTDGTISWYGGRTAVVPNAVVEDAAGNIVHWGLYMTEDVHGNNIYYNYFNTTLGSLPSPNQNLSGGRVFVLNNIYYTGHNGTTNNGLYRILFNRKSILRQDATIDARLGVKMVDCYFLDNIMVKRRTDASAVFMRKYVFETGYGKFKKGRLNKVTELDKDNNEFYNHAFEYYDDITQGETDVFFSAGVEVNACNDELEECQDTDGDGVCDENDDCPQVYGTAGNQGCPDPVDQDCREVSFPMPLNNTVYKHTLGKSFHLPYSDERCVYALTRIKDLTIGNVTVGAAAQNLYLTHYENNSATNLCPSIVTPLNLSMIRNTNFEIPAQNWISSQFSANSTNVSNVSVINTSSIFFSGNAFLSDTEFYNHHGMLLTFLSPLPTLSLDYNLEYRDGNSSYFNDVVYTGSNQLQTSIHSGTGISAVFKVNNVSLSPSSHNLATNLSAFITAFKQQYGEQAEISVTDYIVTIRVYNPTVPLNSIQVGSNSYNFVDCKGTPLARTAKDVLVDGGTGDLFKAKLEQLPNNLENIAFSSPAGNFSYVFQGTEPIGDTDCPSYLNYDYLIQGYNPSFDTSFSLLGASNMKAQNFGAYLGLGIGCKWFTKSTTFGYQWTFSEDTSKSKIAMVDINGDGLDDIVLDEDGTLSFKPHQIERAYDGEGNVTVTHSFGPKKRIFGIDRFYKSVGASKSGNFQVTFGIKKIGGFVGKDKGRSESTSNIYFTDGNGDGLIDIVKNGVVYFNKLNVNGSPTFGNDSAVTENMVIMAEPMTVEVPQEETTLPIPKYDVVKVWEAPADGDIKITNSISRSSDASPVDEVIATIEMGKSTTSAIQCSSVSFLAPSIRKSLYKYTFQTGLITGNDHINPNDPTIIGTCRADNYRIKNVVVGGQTFVSSNPNKLFVANGNEFVGPLDQCPDFPPYSNNAYYDPYPSLRSINSEQNIKQWFEDVILTNVPSIILLETNNLSGTYINNSIYHSIYKWETKVWSYSNLLVGSSATGEVYYNIPYMNAWTAQAPVATTAGSTIVYFGVESNVYINNQLLPGSPFNLFDNPQTFKNALEAQYGPTVSFSGPTIDSPNVPISFQIFGSQILSTIKIEPVSQPSQAIVYNFTVSPQCNSARPVEQSDVAETNRWKNIPLSKEAQNIAIKRWVADGNDLNLPVQQIPVNFSFDVTDNKIDSTLSEKYLFTKDGKTESWIDVTGNKVEDRKKIASLKAILGIDMDDFCKKTQQQNSLSENENRKKSQIEAQAWLDDYYQKQQERINAQARINLQTCSDLPTDMCLLFGTRLNGTNTSVSNTITTASTNCNPSGGNLTVKKGDRIYFRVHSNNSANPGVSWNPRVEYTNTAISTIKDQDDNFIYNSSYSDGFILSKNEPLVFPANIGTANITWPTVNVVNPSDEVTYKIIKRTVTAQENSDDVTSVESEIYTRTFPNAQQITTLTPSGLSSIQVDNGTDPSLTSTDFYFKVISSSNVKWKDFQWKPTVTFTYNTSVIGESGQPEGVVATIEKYYPIVDYSIYKSYPCSPAYTKLDLNQLPSGIGTTPQITINNAGNNFTNLFAGIDNANLWFVVKSNNKTIVRKQIIKTPGGVSILPNNDAVAIPAGNTQLEIGFYADDSQLMDDQVSSLSKLALASNSYVRLTFGNKAPYDVPVNKINLYQRANPKFGPMHRQWGQFMYNPAVVQGAVTYAYGNLIKENALMFNQDQATAINNAVNYLNNLGENGLTETALDNFEATYGNLSNMPLLIATPAKVTMDGIVYERWKGTHNENYASAGGYRAARMDQGGVDFEVEAYDYQGMLETGAFAINKISRGDTENFSGGASVDIGSSFSAGVNASKVLSGNNKSITDYVDFNGDRYPDIVTADKVQYTNTTGGLRAETDGYGDVSRAESDGWGFGAQGSYSKGGDKGTSSKSSDSSFPRFEGFRGNSGGGLSGNFSKGTSIVSRHWMDINGDGLADLLEKDSNGDVTIRLNYGYSNEAVAYKWNAPSAYAKKIFNSASQNISGGLGINKWNGSVEAGISLTSAWNSTEHTLVDMNGDGLLDYVGTGDNINLAINQGNKFTDFGQLSSAFNMKRESVSISSTVNATVTAAITWPLWGFCLKLPAGSLSASLGSTTTSKTKKSISDFDGDGFPDLIEDVGNSKLVVHSSNVRRTDKLKRVTNSLKGTFLIDYKVQKVSYDNPHAKWTMSEVVIYDGYDKMNDGNDTIKKQFKYENGRYDRRERDFYGYETVKTMDMKREGDTDVAYRTLVSKYHNKSYFLNGLLKESYVLKGNDESKKFSRTENFYEVRELDDNNTKMTPNMLSSTFDTGGKEGRRSAAVVLVKTKNYLYELNTNPLLTSQVNLYYDDFGRIVMHQNMGNINDASDNYTSKITYHSNATLDAKHILGVPKSIIVEAPSQKRRRETTVNNNTGRILTIKAYFNPSEFATTTMVYDNYGNLAKVTYPPNDNAQSMSYTYTYDANFYKIEKIQDAYSYSSQVSYYDAADAANHFYYDNDKVVETTDLAGNKMKYGYDAFGRTTNIIGPKEIAASKPYTLKFDYYLKHTALGISENVFVPVAVTSHYDAGNPTNDIQTFTFIDGLGRPIQVKKDIELNLGSAQMPNMTENLSVSGAVFYDEFGRAAKQYHPHYQAKTPSTQYLMLEHNTVYHSATEFDELDRPVKSIDPDENETNMIYSIEQNNSGVLGIKTRTIVSQNGNQDIISDTYKDVLGRVFSTMNLGSEELWTQFTYNPIGELQEYQDAEGIVTSYSYDMLGRKQTIKHPDNGNTSYQYDKASNLTKIQTHNLMVDNSLTPQDRFINYTYDYNRVLKIEYPNMPSGTNISNVYYKYGSSGNQKGRVIWQKDATGEQDFDYGNMGEMTYNRRTVVGPNIPTRMFETRFQYDSWNRLQTMQYPDGENVSYSYDLGGNLKSVAGMANGQSYNYITRIDYDHFEQRAYLKYGNNTETFYTYTATMRRLKNLNAKTAGQEDLFNNSYGYDKVGNVLSVINDASYTSNNMGGRYSHTYEYDELNRLKKANGDFTGSTSQAVNGNDYQSSYRLDMSYNNTHGIETKQQRHNKNNAAYLVNTYQNTYEYYEGTHKVRTISGGGTQVENFGYDHNGNINRRESVQKSSDYYWDESNRLRVVYSNHTMQHYLYDASGERVLKASSDSESIYENGSLVNPPFVNVNSYTTYPNAFMVIDPNGVYSKHYYAGAQRIVSRLGDDKADIFNYKKSKTAKPATDGMPEFDEKALQQAQINDLQQYLDKAKLGKATFKEYRGTTYQEEEKAIRDEAMEANPDMKRAPEPPAPIYFYHPDHLGTSTFLTDANGVAYQFFLNLPFGETMAEQYPDSYYRTPFKFSGKEQDEETGLHYFGARYYDSRISIWMSVDPLAESFPNWNPYNYTMQNPINLIDPDGRSASPIYGEDGKYLGTDSEGFAGDVLFMNEQLFNLLSMGKSEGGISHETAVNNSQTLRQVIGDNASVTFTKAESVMVTNALNHIVSKTEGYESDFKNGSNNNLYKGKMSSSYFESGNANSNPPIPGAWQSENGGHNLGGAFPKLATTDKYTSPGKALITYNLQQFNYLGFTVENIHNTFDHEYGSHFKKGVPGGSNHHHAKAIYDQTLHSSWKNTTKEYKQNMRKVYSEYTGLILKR